MAKKEKEKRTRGDYKYGVKDLVEELDITEQSVRVKLRNNEIEKNEDGVYGWNSQADFKDVVRQLKTKEKDEDDDKPARGKKKVKKVVAKKKKKTARPRRSEDEEESTAEAA